MRAAVVGLALLLAGCSGAKVTKAPDGSVTVEKDGTKVSVNSKDCPRASFVPVYADANMTTCVAATDGAKGGTIVYTSAAVPAVVLGWYKAEAEKAGLKVNLQTDMNLSASEGSRKLMVMVMPEGSGTQVTLNWAE